MSEAVDDFCWRAYQSEVRARRARLYGRSTTIVHIPAPPPPKPVIPPEPPKTGPRRARVYKGPQFQMPMPLPGKAYAYPIGPTINFPYFLEPSKIRAQRLMLECCEKHGFTVPEMIGDRRTFELVWARHELCWEVERQCGWSASRIGRWLGDRDHTTILNSLRKHQKKVDGTAWLQANAMAMPRGLRVLLGKMEVPPPEDVPPPRNRMSQEVDAARRVMRAGRARLLEILCP